MSGESPDEAKPTAYTRVKGKERLAHVVTLVNFHITLTAGDYLYREIIDTFIHQMCLQNVYINMPAMSRHS